MYRVVKKINLTINNISDNSAYTVVSGRVQVNEAHVVTHNVPATNGVIHAIDGVL